MAILIRPVREQFEHDRVIRELEFKLRRRFDVEANVGDEQRVPVKAGGRSEFPDLVLSTPTSGRKAHAIVEVETAESVNRLEAMHEWVRFSRIRAQFHLYVPAIAVDAALRLCKEHRVSPSEVWAFVPYGDQFRFTQVLPTPGILEPDMDLEEARAERRAAQAEQALPAAADAVEPIAPSVRAEPAPPRSRKPQASKTPAKTRPEVTALASARQAAAAFAAVQAAKAANTPRAGQADRKPPPPPSSSGKGSRSAAAAAAAPKAVAVPAPKAAPKVAPKPAPTVARTPVPKGTPKAGPAAGKTPAPGVAPGRPKGGPSAASPATTRAGARPAAKAAPGRAVASKGGGVSNAQAARVATKAATSAGRTSGRSASSTHSARTGVADRNVRPRTPSKAASEPAATKKRAAPMPTPTGKAATRPRKRR